MGEGAQDSKECADGDAVNENNTGGKSTSQQNQSIKKQWGPPPKALTFSRSDYGIGSKNHFLVFLLIYFPAFSTE